MLYLYVSDHTAESHKWSKLAKIQAMLEMVKQIFKHLHGWEYWTINKGELKVWLWCDAESAHMHQFDMLWNKYAK